MLIRSLCCSLIFLISSFDKKFLICCSSSGVRCALFANSFKLFSSYSHLYQYSFASIKQSSRDSIHSPIFVSSSRACILGSFLIASVHGVKRSLLYDSGYHFSVLLGTQRKSSILFKSSINPFKLSSWFRFSDCRIFSFVIEYFRYVSLSSQILLSFCFKFWSSSICDFFWFISSCVGFRFSEMLLNLSSRFF